MTRYNISMVAGSGLWKTNRPTTSTTTITTMKIMVNQLINARNLTAFSSLYLNLFSILVMPFLALSFIH
jgi:hypothetical protein